ncbi:MAG: class I adenylate-forming enzyme family protein, partial [Caulobacteraceae bacterium]
MTRRAEIVSELTASGLFELTEDRSLGYPIRIYKNAPSSLREVFAATEAYADRVFTIYGDEVMTFAEARAKVAALARFLLKQGVKKGDRVSIGMRNYPEWIVAFWACQAVGAVAVALNAWWTSAELAYALEDSTPKVHLVDGERFERIAPLLGKLGGIAVVARRGGAPAGGIDFETASAGDDPALPDADVGPQDVATILYTSGTTGKPKGAYATHRNHVTNIWNTLLGGQVAMAMTGAAPPTAPPPQVGVLQTFPFFHIGGLTGLYLSTFGGSKVALMYKWNAQEAAELIERHRLNSVAGVPIVVRQLLEAARAGGRDITSLAGVASGGAPVPPDLIRRVETEFEQKTSPANGYGLTETTSAVIANGGAEYFAHPNSIGRPVPTCDARVVDENGRDVKQGEIGEIWLRGPNIIPG